MLPGYSWIFEGAAYAQIQIMTDWINKTKDAVSALKASGYFNLWTKQSRGAINFYIFPDLEVDDAWLEERLEIYNKNAKILLGVQEPPVINFYVYPSIDSARNLGITPAISFIKEKEIHGHLKQSPGHELNHILLGQLNPSENLPANGLWEEGTCVYFDGTNTDRKKHALTIDYSEKIIQTPWVEWNMTLPQELYPLAGSIIQYCIARFGLDAVISFLRQLRDGAANEEFLANEIFGVSFEDLQMNWRAWLKDRAI